MNKKIFLIILFALNAQSMPWIELNESNLIKNIQDSLLTCNQSISINSYPVSLGEIYLYLNNINVDDLDKECKLKINHHKDAIKNLFHDGYNEIGYQSGFDDFYLQDQSRRFYKNPLLYFSHTNVSNNFAYKLTISKENNRTDLLLDDSYISYKHNNNVYTIGRKSRWWSPSSRSSIILSNSARPLFGLDIKNFNPIIPDKPLFKFMGQVNYEFFINRFESKREVKNALLFGNRISFKPSDNLDISLLRLAQFGGDGRPTNPETIFNMLIGKDNISKNSSIQNQPGNQLAGIDFKYLINNESNFSIYGQIIGEDEAGYLPSRNFYMLGSEFYFLKQIAPLKVSIDYINTFSGKQNYTYNHNIYKDGLRYYGKPIGASIDADSNEFSISIDRRLSDTFNYKFTIYDLLLNKNLSDKNTWSSDSNKIKGFDITLAKKVNNYLFETILSFKNQEKEIFSDKNFLIRISYRF